VVRTHPGGSAHGGAELTPLGEDIVARYLELLEQAQSQSVGKLDELAALIRPGD